jgi:hypothetical protein
MKFIDYLTEKHFQINPSIDGDVSGRFENWLSDLDIQTLAEYADQYADLKLQQHINQYRSENVTN